MEKGLTITESRPSEVLAALHESADAQREYLFASRDAGTDDLILVAWIADLAGGYIATTDDPSGDLLVWEHVVVPDLRGRGIGERLLLEAVRRTDPGSRVEVDPMAELDSGRLADYYGRLGVEERTASGGFRATVAAVLAISAARHHQSSEADTPVSAIVDAKAEAVVIVAPDQPVSRAVGLMAGHNIGAVVVSSGDDRVEGIFSERDVLIGLDRDGPAFVARPVAEVCTTDVVTCTVEDPLMEVMGWMSDRRIRHVPVTSLGRLVGIVSVGDVVQRRLTVLDAETTRTAA